MRTLRSSTFGSRQICVTMAIAWPVAHAASAEAQAQHTTTQAQQSSSVLVDEAIPDNFDRGRNVSVLERPHPDYDPLDIQAGNFSIAPQVQAGAGATSNVYLTNVNRRSDAFLLVSPSVAVSSDLATGALNFSASGTGRRFISNPRRNETTFDLRGLGSKDIGEYFSVTGEAQYARIYESPDSGAIDPTLAIQSTYHRSYFNLRGQYTAGRARAIVALDRMGINFSNLNLPTGVIDQQYRNRTISRATGEVQYALSPSLSLYAQAVADRTKYEHRLDDGTANRSSNGLRLLGGTNFDLAGVVRGKLGVGYIQRNYDASRYKDAKGVSVEAEVEYFPSELTTIGLRLGRTLEDTNISNSAAFFSNRAEVRVDREARDNIVVSGLFQYINQKYVGTRLTSNYYGPTGMVRYLVSRFITVNASTSYYRRSSSGSVDNNKYEELRGQLTLTYRR